MELNFWLKTSGTWINAIAVLAGTLCGLVLSSRLNQPMQRIIMQGVGLVVLFIGFNMGSSLTEVQGGKVEGVVLGLLAIVMGGLLGEFWQLEQRIESLGNWLKKRMRGGGNFTEGFVAASLLFCVGPMTLIGSFNNGLTGDDTLLVVKATLDGLAAIALASSFGVGVGFSIPVILIFQGGISLTAGILAIAIPNPASHPVVLLVTGVGGLMVIGLGINLLNLTRVRVASFIPALALVPVCYWIAEWISG